MLITSAPPPCSRADRVGYWMRRVRARRHAMSGDDECTVQAVGPRCASGLGQNLEGRTVRVRARMVERLAAEGITHAGLLHAFGQVPRHQFVDSALVNQAYEDTSLPIGLGQTISKPSVVAAMIQMLCVHPGARAVRPVRWAPASRLARVAATRPRCWRTWRGKSSPSSACAISTSRRASNAAW